jgi:hypothetical protein
MITYSYDDSDEVSICDDDAELAATRGRSSLIIEGAQRQRCESIAETKVREHRLNHKPPASDTVGTAATNIIFS